MAMNTGMVMEFKHEMANTRKMIERVPYEHRAWKPHEKSHEISSLATHIARVPTWIGRVVNATEIDLGAPNAFPKVEAPANKEELLALFDKNSAEALKHLEDASDEALMTPWTLRNGENVYYTMPRAAVIRNMALNHQYHHRGQMSVFLRLLDIPVPGMYGPSADEK